MEPFEKEPFEKDELSDGELNQLLPMWKVPTAPARLRMAVFPETAIPWWRTIWTASFRVPMPVACCVAIMLGVLAWSWSKPVPPRVLIRTEHVEVPVVTRVVTKDVVTRTVYRDRSVRVKPNIHELQPVAELRPRIIRSKNAEN